MSVASSALVVLLLQGSIPGASFAGESQPTAASTTVRPVESQTASRSGARNAAPVAPKAASELDVALAKYRTTGATYLAAKAAYKRPGAQFEDAKSKQKTKATYENSKATYKQAASDYYELKAASKQTAPQPAPTTERPGGKPGKSNTGVPAGTKLERHDGNLQITKPGTVIDGLDIHGYVEVKAKKVTIRNSIIRGGAPKKNTALVTSTSNSASLVIEDSELAATGAAPVVDGLRGWNITARRLNIHNVIDGAHFHGPNVTLEKSWIHDLWHHKVDPNGYHKDGSHDDGVQIQTGHNIRIIGNNISGAYTAGIIATQDAGRTSDVRILNNWLDGGGCTVNLSEKGKGPLNGFRIENNVFGRNVTNPAGDDCAIIYPKSSPVSLSNNTYGDNSKTAKVTLK